MAGETTLSDQRGAAPHHRDNQGVGHIIRRGGERRLCLGMILRTAPLTSHPDPPSPLTRRDLERPRPELAIHVLVGDHANAPAAAARHDALAPDVLLVPLILRVYRDGSVAQDGFGAGGGHRKVHALSHVCNGIPVWGRCGGGEVRQWRWRQALPPLALLRWQIISREVVDEVGWFTEGLGGSCNLSGTCCLLPPSPIIASNTPSLEVVEEARLLRVLDLQVRHRGQHGGRPVDHVAPLVDEPILVQADKRLGNGGCGGRQCILMRGGGGTKGTQ